MKNKILIGAGILLTVLILGLIIICGASTPSGTPTKETYEVRVDSVQVEIEGEGARNIPLSILTDNIQFNAEIENKEYTDNTLGNLFVILKDSYILWSSLNNKYIEVIVLSSQGKGVYYFKGIEADLFNKPNPWGWNKLKNMTVKEIKEINNMKTSFMQIVVSDE